MPRINIYAPGDEFGSPRTLAGWFNPDSAVESVQESTDWDGNSHVSRVAGGTFEHEHLYRTPGGRWVLNHWSQWQGSTETYEFVTDEQAKDWLLRDGDDEIVEKWFGEIEEESGPGRPEIGGFVSLRLGAELARVDAWAEKQGVSRAEAVRRLVSAQLDLSDLSHTQAHHLDGDPRNNDPGNLELRDTPTTEGDS